MSWSAGAASVSPNDAFVPSAAGSNFIAFFTNGPAVTAQYRRFYTNVYPDPTRPPFNRPEFDQYRRTVYTPYTNVVFHRYVPDSLNHRIWTNFIARTNGRSTRIWSVRERPADWPKSPPTVCWNRESLMWGMRGLTALSPAWEGEGLQGQVPITALTRRHGYTRGHSMGPDGFRTTFAGKKIWFLTLEDKLVEVKVLREVVRTRQGSDGDYTLVLFDRDLPRGIEPIGVTHPTNYHRFFMGLPEAAPMTLFLTEQGGSVSAQVPGFTHNTWKPGDSGSPNLIPLPGELVFYGGRSTSGPSAEMQQDMDELSRLERLDPARYKMQWTELDR